MQYKLIYNPIAGGGRAQKLLPRLVKNFKAAGAVFDVHTTSGPGDAVEAARRAAADGFDVAVAVGGDGTVNEVLNGIVGTAAALAAVHGGKGNDFARTAQMPCDIDAASAVLLRGRQRSFDLGRVLGRYFINSVGVGFDAAVAHRVNQGVKPFTGVSAYIYAVFRTLFSYRPTEMEITIDGSSLTLCPVLVAVGIGKCYGGGMMIVPDAFPDDGFFDVCVIDWMAPAKLAYHFPKVFKGTHTRLTQTSIYRAREVHLKLSRAHPLHMEGEVLMGDKMHFTLEPRGMKVISGSSAVVAGSENND